MNWKNAGARERIERAACDKFHQQHHNIPPHTNWGSLGTSRMEWTLARRGFLPSHLTPFIVDYALSASRHSRTHTTSKHIRPNNTAIEPTRNSVRVGNGIKPQQNPLHDNGFSTLFSLPRTVVDRDATVRGRNMNCNQHHGHTA
jgi:hypothetical protein